MPTVLEAELYNLVIEPTIKDQVIAAQKKDKGMAHIRDVPRLKTKILVDSYETRNRQICIRVRHVSKSES